MYNNISFTRKSTIMQMRLYYIDCQDKDINKFMPFMKQINIIRKGFGKPEYTAYLLGILKSHYVSEVLSNDPSLIDNPAFVNSTGKPDIYVYYDNMWVSIRKLPTEIVDKLLAR